MLETALRPYQIPVVERLIERGNVLVAYDTGVGKTLGSIGAAEHLLGTGEIRAVLIVCPAALRLQWARVIAEHTDVETRLRRIKKRSMPVPTDRWCRVVDGTPAARAAAYAQIKADPPDYIIAGYDTVADDIRVFRRLADMVIIDEATVLASLTSRRAKRLKTLKASYRVALTATPIEHRPDNVYKIFEWLAPGLLGDAEPFDRAYVERDRFGNPVRFRNLDVLHEILAPAMLRLTIDDPAVAPYMPTPVFETWPVTMDAATRSAYKVMAVALEWELSKLKPGESFSVSAYYAGQADTNSGAGKVMAIYTAMQMLLDHPELVRASADDYADDDTNTGSRYAAALCRSGALDEVTYSPKLAELARRLERIFADDPDHKVIVVSRFKRMADLIRAALPGVGAVVYNGDLRDDERAEAVDAFESDPDTRLLLMSHAGAYGLDLPAATHLVNFDPAQSAGQRRQINGRHQRASSKHAQVYIIDLIVRDSIEVRRHAQLTVKDRVFTAVVDGYGADASGGVDNDVQSLSSHVNEVLAA